MCGVWLSFSDTPNLCVTAFLFQDIKVLADLALTLAILRCFTLLGKYVSCGGRGEGGEGRRGEGMGNM